MKKNVILLSVDDMIDVVRYRDAYGVKIKTPNIDRLMEMGVTYENAFTPVPLCSPARAALVTSQSPFATGVDTNNTVVQDHVPIENTIFGALHDAG
jgi:arylsulfatase A-like enzyme